MDVVLAIGALAEELDIGAGAIDGEVASSRQGLEDIDLCGLYGEGIGIFHLAHDGDIVVGDIDLDAIVGIRGEVATDLFLDEGGCLLDGHALDVELADKGIVDITLVVHQVEMTGACSCINAKGFSI